MKLSNQAYDIIKSAAQYVLPALGTMYFALSKIWGLPYPEQIVGTIMAFDAFLGALLGLSNIRYQTDQKVMTRLNQYTQPELLVVDNSEGPQPVQNGLIPGMTKETYDVFYWIAQIFIPASGALYFGLASLWGFPYGEQVVATLSAVDAMLGVLLGLSTAQYKASLASGTA